MPRWFAYIFLTLGVFSCSDFDADMAARMRSDLDTSTENLPDIPELTAQLERLQQFLANSPSQLQRDTSVAAQQFRSARLVFEKLNGEISMYEEQFLESHSQLIDLLESYENKEISTEKAQIEYENIGTRLTEAANGLKNIQEVFEENSTHLMKALATWRAEQKIIE